MTMKKPVSFYGQAGRRQLLAVLGSLAVFSFLSGRLAGKRGARRTLSNERHAIDCGAGETSKTVRMLTRDGTLVDVDPAQARTVKKISDEELREWIRPSNF